MQCLKHGIGIKKFNFGKGNYNGLANSLDLDWESILLQGTNDIDVMWSKFKVILFENCTEFIPQTNNFDSWKKITGSVLYQKKLEKILKRKIDCGLDIWKPKITML